MVLTVDDIAAIAAVMEEHHQCRYDIAPEDMKAVVDFVQGVQKNVTEYRRGVRKAVIKIAVYATVAGIVSFIVDKLGIPRALLNVLTK